MAAPLECLSAIHRRRREGSMPEPVLARALSRLQALAEDLDRIAPGDDVLRRASLLIAAHPLRAGDALQLAAALAWCEGEPEGETFACLDDRLREAAAAEGFRLAPA